MDTGKIEKEKQTGDLQNAVSEVGGKATKKNGSRLARPEIGSGDGRRAEPQRHLPPNSFNHRPLVFLVVSWSW